MHTHRVGPGEEGTCLPILQCGVGEDQRVVGGESLLHSCPLPDIAITDDRSRVYPPIFDDKPLCINVIANVCHALARRGIVDDHPGVERFRPLHPHFVADDHVHDLSAVDHHRVVANLMQRLPGVKICLYDWLEMTLVPFRHPCHQQCCLRTQPGIDGHRT